jgi:maltose alpha-D-glucosyltransferase/alpha-amylase
MRIYGHALRRRLPPMLGGDARRLELAYHLLMALPGTPLLLYGEEIGLGDDLDLPGRLSVRVPMPWSDGPNGGFSSAPPGRLIRPMIADGKYGYRRLNVSSQRAEPASLLNRVRRLIAMRKACPEVGRGSWRVFEPADPAVLALRHERDGGAVVTVHNLGAAPSAVRVELDEPRGERLVELLGDGQSGPDAPAGMVQLPAYESRWFRVVGGR